MSGALTNPLCSRVLFVGAHLDDIELAAGGTAARLTSLGAQVYWLVLSDSGYRSYDGAWRRDSSEALREGQAAAEVLGVTMLDVRTLPAKDIENSSEVVEAINAVIDSFEPGLIVTHWPFDTHRSHANTALATMAAGRYSSSILMYEPLRPSGRSYVAFRPQAYVAIDAVMETKLAAIRCHASELRKYGDRWLEGVEARARFRGYEMGVRYAEAFEVLRLELMLDQPNGHAGRPAERPVAGPREASLT